MKTQRHPHRRHHDEHDDHEEDHDFLLRHGQVHLTLAELSSLLRSAQRPVTPKNGLSSFPSPSTLSRLFRVEGGMVVSVD